jgi:hypothetical protein
MNIHKNYILLIHDNPKQVFNLISALRDGHSSFFIHVDLKTDIKPFVECLNDGDVFFVERRVCCIWGDYSIVIAILECVKEVMEHDKKGFTILLSGQDYPIRSREAISDYLARNVDFNFINLHYPLDPKNKEFYIDRLDSIKLNFSSKRGDYFIVHHIGKMKPRNFLHAILLMFLKKSFHKDFFKIFCVNRKPFTHFGLGQQWWSMNWETLQKVWNYYEQNRKRLDAFYKNVFCADESFFQTIIAHLKESDVDIKLKPSNTYTNWSRPVDYPHPVVFKNTEEDLRELNNLEEHFLFARKFHLEDSKPLMEYFNNLNVNVSRK